jgi:hypothetical protein
MYEDNGFPAGQNNVWTAGQRAHVEPKPKAHFVDKGSDDEFGLGVSCPNSRHVPAAFRS